MPFNNSRISEKSTHHLQVRRWAELAKAHAQPDTRRSVIQLITTVLPLAGLWAAMMITVGDAYWVTLILSVPAAAFLVRLFIIQHDCGHRSFFHSRGLNDKLGALIGIITLTPHAYWRQAHNSHHATCGNLEKRGIGDVNVLTVDEYLTLPKWKRLAYRLYRNPMSILGIGPIYLFFVKYRLPLDLIRSHPKLLISVMGTNLGILGAVAGLGYAFGFIEVLMVQVPISLIASATGVWLFYVQHQFEHTFWKDDRDWDFFVASVMASSFYDLPRLLRWFTGCIGIHHIHHLSNRVPNYRLSACLNDMPELRQVNRIGLKDSLSCFKLALWDEARQRLISFKALTMSSRKTDRKLSIN